MKRRRAGPIACYKAALRASLELPVGTGGGFGDTIIAGTWWLIVGIPDEPPPDETAAVTSPGESDP